MRSQDLFHEHRGLFEEDLEIPRFEYLLHLLASHIFWRALFLLNWRYGLSALDFFHYRCAWSSEIRNGRGFFRIRFIIVREAFLSAWERYISEAFFVIFFNLGLARDL